MLNQNMSWNEVGAISTGPGTKVSDAFQLMFGNPTKELLPAGMELYKFNGFSTLAQGPVTSATQLSPWWSAVAAFKHDGGLVQRLKIAEANGVSMREWGRLTSVIKENWSSLDWLLTITLAEPVYAWFGGFKGMSRIDPGTQSETKLSRARVAGTGSPAAARSSTSPTSLWRTFRRMPFGRFE